MNRANRTLATPIGLPTVIFLSPDKLLFGLHDFRFDQSHTRLRASGGLLADNSHLGLDKILEQSGRHELGEWELAFCKWAAAHQRARVKEQEAMATYLAGTPISWINLRHLRATKSFRNWYGRYRAKILQRLDEHREAFESENVGKAIEAHKWALEEAVKEKDYRAIPPLVEPAIKALYKHTEEQMDKPMIVLNLGGFAQQHLDDPVEDVEFEQLEAGEATDDDTK